MLRYKQPLRVCMRNKNTKVWNTPAFNLSNKQTKDLCLLLLYVKQYHYGCKSMQKKTDTSEFISKFIMQLEIEV